MEKETKRYAGALDDAAEEARRIEQEAEASSEDADEDEDVDSDGDDDEDEDDEEGASEK